MARKIEISRDEAEMLVDLLMLADDMRLKILRQEIREEFGMRTEQEQMEYMGWTEEQYKQRVLDSLPWLQVRYTKND